MQPLFLLSASIVLFCTNTMALLGRNGKQASPTELNRLNVRGRENVVPETLHVRADPTATSTSHSPTTSTPYAVPLTTTFIPPESCNEEHLTMLSSPGYFVWLNEPVPVPETTMSACYPPEFLSYYTPYHVNSITVGSMVPLMSPLVHPFGWKVVASSGDYQGLCPSGYMFTPPETPIDSKRPAYGGTCYSDWPLSSSAFVEVYGSDSLSGTMLLTASTTPYAAYAHVIDGIVVSTLSPTSSRSSSSSGQTSAGSAQSGGSGNTSLSPGAIAGIVIGIVAAVALIALGVYLFARRRHRQPPNLEQQQAPPPLQKDDPALTAVSSPIGQNLTGNPSEVMSMETGVSELGTESHLHELEAGLPTEKP
ncbi:hypothetical protein F4680DRAFT_404779 [Xylaria scruposa]|nr:hypothetical protein F4680DRAFT_404779 [Xylaria scruposa]